MYEPEPSAMITSMCALVMHYTQHYRGICLVHDDALSSFIFMNKYIASGIRYYICLEVSWFPETPLKDATVQ